VVESFFASLKVERLHERKYATLEQLRTDVADYIERFYNRQRRHSTLGYLSPAIYEL
jgi:putative transposase